MDSKIKQSFWSDRKVENLDCHQKLALLWLFTAHPHSAGWVECSQRRFEFETGSPYKALIDACAAMGDGIVSHEKGFWIRNYVRHQVGDGEGLAKNNISKAITASLVDLPPEIQGAFREEYPELNERIEALHKPLETEQPELPVPAKGQGRKDNLPTTEPAIRIAKLFNRRLDTRWSDREVYAFKKIGRLNLDDLALVEHYYTAERKKPEGVHRRDLQTFLNNFSGEVDRARLWMQKEGKSLNGHKSNPPLEPPGWRDWLGRAYPDATCKTWEEVPDSAKQEFAESTPQLGWRGLRWGVNS